MSQILILFQFSPSVVPGVSVVCPQLSHHIRYEAGVACLHFSSLALFFALLLRKFSRDWFLTRARDSKHPPLLCRALIYS